MHIYINQIKSIHEIRLYFTRVARDKEKVAIYFSIDFTKGNFS